MNNSCKIFAIEHISLNGVYQGPARKDEDTRNKFKLGGWSVEGSTPELQIIMGKYMSKDWSLLSGKITYQDLYEG